MENNRHLRISLDPREVHEVSIRGQAAGLCFWIRQAFIADPEREIVVVALGSQADAHRAEQVLAGRTAAIPVPERILRELAKRDREAVPRELVDSKYGHGAYELERALLSNFNPCMPTIQLIHLYLFRLSRKRTLDVQQTIQWLLDFWHLGDVGCSNAVRQVEVAVPDRAQGDDFGPVRASSETFTRRLEALESRLRTRAWGVGPSS